MDSPEGLKAAFEGGADRVELCSALALGGLTPTLSMLGLARQTGIDTAVMIRPRAGDFVWTSAEVDMMRSDISTALACEVAGIVIGANLPDGRLDVRTLRKLLAEVDTGADKVLHRCIDLTPDPVEAVETAIALGFDRILTSGGEVKAADAIGTLKAMFDRARGRITIMPGSGITAENVAGLLALLPVEEVHASCAVAQPQNPRAVALGFPTTERRVPDLATVRAMRAALG